MTLRDLGLIGGTVAVLGVAGARVVAIQRASRTPHTTVVWGAWEWGALLAGVVLLAGVLIL